MSDRLLQRLEGFRSRHAGDYEETTGTLDFNGRRLLYVMTVPTTAARRRGVVVCPSLFEFSRFQPTEVAFLRAAAAAGFPGIYVEPVGMGDSDGSLDECTIETRTHVALAAFSFMRSSLPQGESLSPCWMGARLGAAVAMLAAEASDGAAALVAWDPVADGATYWSQARRLARISAVSQRQRSFKDPEQLLEETGRASVLWLPFTQELKGDLQSMDRAGTRRQVEGPALIAAINDDLLEASKQRFASVSSDVDFISLGREGVDHLGVSEAGDAIGPTLEWMSRRLS